MRDIEIVFATGADGAFFASSPTAWYRKDLPRGINKIFDKTGGEKVVDVYDLVLGDRDSYWVNWRDADRKHHWQYHGLPDGLTTWMEERNDKGHHKVDMRRLRIALGPRNSSYWASDGHHAKFKGLPDSLMEKLTESGTTHGTLKRPFPTHVALGVHHSWVMAKASGTMAWSLSNHYPGLKAALKDLKGKGEIVNSLAMDQHDGGNFLLTTDKGHTYFDVIFDLEDTLHGLLNPPHEHHGHQSHAHHGSPKDRSEAYKPGASFHPTTTHAVSAHNGSRELLKSATGVFKLGFRIIRIVAFLHTGGATGL